MSDTAPAQPELDALRARGAAQVDAVGWHHIETLAMRTQAQSGQAKALLQTKLHQALQRFETRMGPHALQAAAPPTPVQPSALAALLQDMGQKNAWGTSAQTAHGAGENPRMAQFKNQLSKLSVQKQVSQAIAHAPLNAGPINSHMLVLRSLGLMRDISPDYLHRFMAHVDTLLYLDSVGQSQALPKKAAAAAKSRP